MKEELIEALESSSRLKLIIVILHQMGFKSDLVERAILHAKCMTIEEIIPHIAPNESTNMMEHKFMP